MIALRWLPPEQASRTRNAAWNWFARVWQAALQLAAVPVFIALLGQDAYGLVVLNATLAATIAFLDQLVSPALSREMSRHDGSAADARRLRDLLATLEAISCATAVAAAAFAIAAAFLLTDHWTDAGRLDQRMVAWSLALMALGLAAQWPGLLHASGLAGLQRQGLLSASRIIWTTLQYGGGALALLALDRNPAILFAWLCLTHLLQTLSTRWLLSRVLPGEGRGTIRKDSVGGVIGFAGGTLAVGMLTALIAQLDKYLVAAIASPQQFAAYGLAFAVATQAISLFTGPYASAIQPQMSYLVASGRTDDLRRQFPRWNQALLIITISAGLLFALFAERLIGLWLGTASDMAREVSAIADIFVVGSMLGGAITVYMTVLVATGRFRYIYLASAIYIVVFAAVALSSPNLTHLHYASLWIAFNAISAIVVAAGVMLRVAPELRGGRLAGEAIATASAAALIAFGPGRFVPAMGPDADLLSRAVLLFAGAALLLVALPHGRAQLLDSLRYALGRFGRLGRR
jgi:O-antigen/teichoic acid export membrane protein